MEWPEIELIGAEIVDGEAFLQEYNIDRESIFGFPVRKVRTVSYICDEGVGFPIVDILSFLIIAERKKMAGEIWFPRKFSNRLNPLAKKPSQLSVGETEELAMAIGLHKDAFRNTEWSNLSTSDISLVMSVYPQKVILQSS